MSLEVFRRIAEVEFADIVKDVFRFDHKLRISLMDGSFVDLYYSKRIPDRFAFHWECLDSARSIYRYDNIPDKNWRNFSTYPFHFHKKNQDNVEDSPFPLDPISGFRAFMEFIQNRMTLRKR